MGMEIGDISGKRCVRLIVLLYILGLFGLEWRGGGHILTANVLKISRGQDMGIDDTQL